MVEEPWRTDGLIAVDTKDNDEEEDYKGEEVMNGIMIIVKKQISDGLEREAKDRREKVKVRVKVKRLMEFVIVAEFTGISRVPIGRRRSI